MSQPAKRLSYAEAKLVEETNGKFCRGCRTVYPSDQVATSFGTDERTRDGLTRLCLSCIALRDAQTETRVREGRSDAQAEYRRSMKALQIANARAQLEAALPNHAIPPRALPDYPPTSPPPSRTPAQDAILTRLYGRLIDAPVENWEQFAGVSRRKIMVRLANMGPGAFDIIDEHLKAFGLDPLTP